MIRILWVFCEKIVSRCQAGGIRDRDIFWWGETYWALAELSLLWLVVRHLVCVFLDGSFTTRTIFQLRQSDEGDRGIVGLR